MLSQRAMLHAHAGNAPLLKISRQEIKYLMRNPCPRYQNRSRRSFSSSSKRSNQQDEPFGSRARKALGDTKIKWYPIPVGLGIGFLGLAQFYRVRQREKALDDANDGATEIDSEGQPKKRKRIRPSGPWQVQIMSTLPLKAISRAWGKFNELEIPYYLRVPGFRLYSWIFGVK